jgi:hypothetical protein
METLLEKKVHSLDLQTGPGGASQTGCVFIQTIIKKCNHHHCLLDIPYREFRRYARTEINIDNNLYEVDVKCSVEASIKRDPKGHTKWPCRLDKEFNWCTRSL